MPATKYDIVCEQGADLELIVTYLNEAGEPINLTGGLARMQARKTIRATTPFVDLDSDALGGLTLGDAEGTIAVRIPAAQTDEYDPVSDAVYDLEFEGSDGSINRVIEGKFKVVQQVTR